MINAKRFDVAVAVGDDVSEAAKPVEKLLTIICQMGYRLICVEIRTTSLSKPNRERLEGLLGLIGNIEMVYPVQFKVTVRSNFCDMDKKTIRMMARKNIGLQLFADNLDFPANKPLKALKPYKGKANLLRFNAATGMDRHGCIEIRTGFAGLGDALVFNVWDFDIEKTTKMFSEWFFDTKGVHVDYFSQCLKVVLFDANMDVCRYNSCLGKTLHMNGNGDLSFCLNDTSAVIANINDVESYVDIFENGLFLEVLDKTKQFRNKCKNDCGYFQKCQGGCPMNLNNMEDKDTGKCDGNGFITLLGNVEKTLKNFFSENISLDNINPLARKDILNAIAINSSIGKILA